ncbi:MAG: hypothetical protein JSW12_22430 [Deltaproteobacteria bacterium]|nr:MAG: hypothetical protein JSW12_22430 [Deltaproteobacteria bacterium]
MSIAYDMLLSASRPLYINAIIIRASEEFHMNLDRESLVSAIAKNVKSGSLFKGVVPNTFTILDSEAENGP